MGKEECDTTDNILMPGPSQARNNGPPKMGLFGGFGASSKNKEEKSETDKETSNWGFGPPRNRPSGNKK